MVYLVFLTGLHTSLRNGQNCFKLVYVVRKMMNKNQCETGLLSQPFEALTFQTTKAFSFIPRYPL